MKKKTKNQSKAAPAVVAASAENGRDQLRYIKRAELYPDPDQPRKNFSEASLDELALSIRENGIVQPLVVRLVKAKYIIREPDLHSDGKWTLFNTETQQEEFQGQENHCYLHVGGPDSLMLKDHYVIVAGERRCRASAPREIKTDGEVVKWSGLDELPCVVRDVAAHRVFAQQFIENHQRENLSGLEEAEALQKQLEVRKVADPTFSPEKLAAELGMSRAGVYERLKLTRLHPPVREALVAGKISMSVAAVVAIIPLPKQQEKLLAKITNELDYEFPFSVRDVAAIVEREYVKQLSEAPFKPADVFLWTKQFPEDVFAPGLHKGEMQRLVTTCAECPHRSGNMVAQFPELAKRPNVCTRPDCFALKVKAYWLDKAEAARAEGQATLTETEFKRNKDQYVKAADYSFAQNHYYEPWDKLFGRKKPEATLVATSAGLVTVYKRDEALGAARANGHKFAAEPAEQKPQTAEELARENEKQKAKLELGQRREAFVEAQYEPLGKLLAKVKEATAWEMVLGLLRFTNGCADTGREKLLAGKNPPPRRAVLAKMFADEEAGPLDYNYDWSKPVVEVWKLAGIDLPVAFEKAEKETQSTLVLPAKGKPEQGKLLDVKPGKRKMSAAGRAKIAAQAKARWAKVKAGAK